VPDLILNLKEDLIAAGTIDAKEGPVDIENTHKDTPADVQAFEGFEEEASRLVFHFADKFADLAERPPKKTYLPSGVMENEPGFWTLKAEHEVDDEREEKELKEKRKLSEDEVAALMVDVKKLEAEVGHKPSREELLDAQKKASVEKIKVRGLVSYPFAQDVADEAEARKIIVEDKSTHVFPRPNGTFGVSQMWPMKINSSFHKSYKATTNYSEVDPTVFQPQAVAEFERTLKILFGPEATKRSPIIYAKNAKINKLVVFKGTAEAIEAFLRFNPEACDLLMIAKLYPGGFVAINSIGGGSDPIAQPPKKNSYKQFDFTPGEEYVLYTKVGYENMACIKSYAQFVGECKLGPRRQDLEMDATTADEFNPISEGTMNRRKSFGVELAKRNGKPINPLQA